MNATGGMSMELDAGPDAREESEKYEGAINLAASAALEGYLQGYEAARADIAARLGGLMNSQEAEAHGLLATLCAFTDDLRMPASLGSTGEKEQRCSCGRPTEGAWHERSCPIWQLDHPGKEADRG